MPEMENDVAEEQVIINRLAQAHKVWRDGRPPPTPKMTPKEHEAMMRAAMEKMKNPEPQDVVAIREVQNDALGTEIQSQLSIVGWRLYAKGGSDLLRSIYTRLERDQHPGFAAVANRAWEGIGFSDDPKGIYGRKLRR